MYEKHFGLKSRPFGAKAEGAGVFVGPQQAATMSSLTKGLAATDAVVTVTGPVGVGKTTIVSKALESISPGRMVAWVGRMQLAPDEVLELLLAGFGVGRNIKGTIQRFAAFRRLLAERAAAGAQVAIVVEDAHRIGSDALVEIEALTAADAGDATAANIILMGQPNLSKLMASPDLARLNQRTRLRQKIAPLSETEVTGYLTHCIREAGGDFAALFDAGVANIVFKCSQGVPRVINTLCETALTAAMQDGLTRVSAGLMQQVAADAFDYEGTHSHAVLDAATQNEAPTAAPVESANAEPETVPESESESEPETAAAPLTEAATTAEPPAAEAPQTEAVIPDLINDTQPGLQPAAMEEPPQPDVEATQTQKTLSAAQFDEAKKVDDEAGFSLDDALTVDAGETNVMPGITPNLDELAAQGRQAQIDPQLAADPTENIPTLSNSMRIDVEVEVEKAKQEIADEAAPEQSAEAPTAPAASLAPPQPGEIALPADSAAEPKAANTAPPAAAVPELPQSAPPVAETPAAELPQTTESVPPPQPVQEVTAPSPEPAIVQQAPAEAGTELPAEPIDSPQTPEPANDAWSNVGHDADAPDVVAEVEADPEPLVVDTSDLPSVELELETEAPALPPEAALSTGEVAAAPPAQEPAVAEPAPEQATAPTVPPQNEERRLPDIDALEKALDAAKNGDLALEQAPPPVAEQDEKEVPAPLADVPEITLDDALPKAPEVDPELLKVAEQIGRASSLEDMNDVMAETIFGSQALDDIAAAVVANPPEEQEVSPVQLDETEIPAAANDAADSAEAKPAAPEDAGSQGAPEGAAQRLDMVKALNNGAGKAAAGPREDIQLGGDMTAPPRPRGPQPEPIEQQINTSMTQTLQALSSSKPVPEEAEQEKKPGGLFSRFRKSS